MNQKLKMEYFNKKKQRTTFQLYVWQTLLCCVIVVFVSGCSSEKQKNAEVKYKEGLSHYQQGRYQEAVEAYKQAILIKSDYAMAHNDLGAAYASLGRFQEAIECYKEARRINPRYEGTHFNLGMAYGQLNNWKEAVEAYKQAVRIKPKDVDAQFNLGLAYLAVDDKSSVLDILQVLRNLDQEKASKFFALISPSVGYTILEEDKSIQNKIIVSILVGKGITEEDIIRLLKELCNSYKASYASVTIWMFTSREQFESGKLSSVAKIILRGDEPWDMHIDRDQLEYLHSQPVEKFGLSDEKRREIFKEMGADENRAITEAVKVYPYLDNNIPGWTSEAAAEQNLKQGRHRRMLEEKYRNEASQKHGLTREQLGEINGEGGKNKWPRSASPNLEELLKLGNTSLPVSSKEWTKLRGGNIMAISKEAHDQAYGLIRSKDEEAFKKMFLSGLIQETTEGADVYVENRHIWDDLAEIRSKGDTKIYWVLKSALYFVGGDVAPSVTIPVIQNNIDACKVEGISIDKNGAVVFVAHGKKFDTVKVGESVCGGEVVKIYAPKEPDGVTPSTSSDLYGYRVRMKFVDGEKILKNGDYISGEPQSSVQEPVQSEPETEVVSSPLNTSPSVGSDFYRKLCDNVFSEYERASTLDSNFDEEQALQVYKEVIPKAKEAYSTLDLADKGRLHKIIEHSELREREISKYLEAVVPIRGQFNTPEMLSEWLKSNIHYESDRVGSDYWQAPYETLTKKTGDCEDYAILAQALLNEIGIRSRVIMVSYSGDYKYKGKAHAMCVFQRDGVYEYFSGSVLHKPIAFSIEKIMDQDYPEWLVIKELDYKAKTRVEIGKKKK